MRGELDDALQALIVDALPRLFGGDTPPVRVDVTSGLLELDPHSDEAVATEPRPDDQLDELPFDADSAAGPYDLSRPPYPGPRRVRLVTADGDRVALTAGEVDWDAADPRRFTLQLRPDRDLTAVDAVEILYGIVSVFTRVKAVRTLTMDLAAADADVAPLAEAEALVIAVVELNREWLANEAQVAYLDGDYGATVTVKRLRLTASTAPTDDRRLLTVRAEVELKGTRALGEDEGRPIERIRTPGRPVDPDRPVDVRIDVQA
jgi:hypothetical protein